MITTTEEVRIVVFSACYDDTRRFYEELLGLTAVKEWDHGGGSLGVVYAIGTLFLEVLQRPKPPAANDFYIYIKVEDVDGLWTELRDRAPVVDPIATHSWGHRNFSIRDPNGYKLKFFTELS